MVDDGGSTTVAGMERDGIVLGPRIARTLGLAAWTRPFLRDGSGIGTMPLLFAPLAGAILLSLVFGRLLDPVPPDAALPPSAADSRAAVTDPGP